MTPRSLFAPMMTAAAAALMGCSPEPPAGPVEGTAAPVPDAAAADGGAVPDAGAFGFDAADFAAAFEGFETDLEYLGPSPQESGPPETPAGAERVGYRPPDMPADLPPLAAFVSPDPGDGGKRPAVLFLHGGFGFGGSDWDDAAPFREAGFVTMTPILRGENGQPGVYTFFHQEVRDVLAAADALAALPYVDPGRVYFSGHSAGGTLAVLAAEYLGSQKDPGVRPAGVASLSGSMDVRFILEDPDDWRRVFAATEREAAIRSPGAFAASVDPACPTLLIRGAAEPYFAPADEATAAALTAAGGSAETAVVPGDHWEMVAPGAARAAAFFRELDAAR